MSLNGIWYNELNSSMNLQVNGNVITGTYSNAVGSAAGDYALYGVIDPNPSSSSQGIAWAVSWVRLQDGSNFHSVTSWSGQYQIIDGDEVITAEWLLTAETAPDQDWSSTNVGHDVFTRSEPTAKVREKRTKLSAWSHPNK